MRISKRLLYGLFISVLLIAVCSPILFAGWAAIPGTIGKSTIISATDTAGEVIINRRHVTLVNDGPDEFYFLVNTDTDATTSNSYLSSGESITMDSNLNGLIFNIQYICDTGETASVRYWGWD